MRFRRSAVRALAALAAGGAGLAGCGGVTLPSLPSVTIPTVPSLSIGSPPSDAAAKRYGVVDVPSRKVLFLPKGDVRMYFSEFVQGGDGDVENGEVPPLNFEVSGRTGGPPYPKVTQHYGEATEVNGHIWLEINTIDVTRAGEYRIVVSGNTSGYIMPQLYLGP